MKGRRVALAALGAGVVLLAAPARQGPLLLGADDPVPAPVEELRLRVDRVLDQGRYGRATWGLLAVSLDRGDTLLVRNPELPLIPASNLKVVTSAAALHHLGSGFRFITYVLTDAPVVDGVVQGNLIVYGTGDPGISDRFHRTRDTPFQELAAQLTAAGIREIRGRVMGDGSFLQGPLLGDGWEAGDLNEWFAAPSGALSFNENVFSVRVRPGAVSRPPELLTVPEHLGVLVSNEAVTVQGRGRHPLWLLRDAPEDPIRVVGELSATSRDVWRQMTVRDPALAAAHGFTHVLRQAGIAVTGYPGSLTEREDSPVTPRTVWRAGEPMRVLATFTSPPLGEYLQAVNQRSHNLYADLILKTLGRMVGEEGSFQGGSAVVTRYLTEVVGIPEDQVEIRDGSGLSILNRISAGGLLGTLRYLAGTPEWEAFWESLPEAGTARLFRRMARTAAAGNLRAKTGTVDRVSALTGMVRTADGERIVFSIVGNELPSETGAKRLEDQVGQALAEWRR
ncbi:MAG TPA: D-alanyl-D-alanine carboxypeptidase/D-alanyl-D-alanine-endopeptidase [Longimicrobiales bacterium]|nr:D-alanyl-D-alanine carboxypeptidase/D-alanyl-D-alanine-endopeptidase [Longimicrobiales bacterium]